MSEAPRSPEAELTYDVSLSPATFGLLRHRPEAGHQAFDEPAPRCHELFHGSSQPCADCPLLAPEDAPWPRAAGRKAAGSRQYRLVRAERSGGEWARVTVNLLPEASVSALLKAKVEALADQASLTDRERSVLAALLLGGSLGEIAKSLGITARTVKFHQQNLLGKLGADSRADLLRLVL